MMRKGLKILLFSMAAISFIGEGVCFYACFQQLAQKISFQGEELRVNIADLNTKLEKVQATLDHINNAYQSFHDGLIKVQDDQIQIRKSVEDFSSEVTDVKASTTTQIRELKKSAFSLEERIKVWVKESLATLSGFESNLDANNKDLDTIVSARLPGLAKALDALKKQQGQDHVLIQDLKSKNISNLESQVDDLKKRLTNVQENTLDVILKTESARKL